jgi:excisionase family DNA binding protein
VTAGAGEGEPPIHAVAPQVDTSQRTGRATRSRSSEGSHAPLTIEAAAERLGVSPRLVRRLVNERRIGFVRVGRFIRLRQEDIDSYLDDHFQPPVRTGSRR